MVSPALILTFPPPKYSFENRGAVTDSPTVMLRSPPEPAKPLPDFMIISPPSATPCFIVAEPATIDASPPSAAPPLTAPLCI